ncbi:hypothetical protein HWV07_09200 [Natronomonas salina]|uniref:hypothetical protein n=1 Tax=Natronomonas salina TaxID=1710540 RepID=UPI0015B68238|nr:hypothetical protein [Natronomonas salina]QLD89199.1 hypothetical protein HWV07_09200 [Natronomonas salina]
MTDISSEVMESLYREEKILAEDVSWDHRFDARYSLNALVHAIESDAVLTVRGEIWEKGYSFSLHYRNNIIRLWDFNDHHQGIEGGHKHPYTPDAEYGEPYPVDDVSTSDVNQALIDFLEECTIRHEDATIDEIRGIEDYV